MHHSAYLKLRFTIGIIVAITVATAPTGCSGGGAGGEQGGHGPEGGHEPGGDGGDRDDGATGSDVPFESDGMSRGVFESIPLARDESFAGLLNDTEIAVRFDAASEVFIGRLRNEASVAVCDVRASILLDGSQMVDHEPFALAGLTRFGRADFELAASHTSFAHWTVRVETTGCSSAPEGSGEGGAGNEGSEGGHDEGSGGSQEGGGEGSEDGGEEGDESTPPIPLTEAFAGVFRKQKFAFAFDASTGAFRGTVENPTSEAICASRTEIHLGVGTEVIELGPTMPVDLRPAELIKIVMSADGYALDTYSLHPESSACP